MNETYLHLVLTHIPIVGSLIAFLLLFSGWLQKSKDLTSAALVLLVAIALITVAVQYTGEEAEKFTKRLPGFSQEAIHAHEEAGELAFWLMEFVGIGAAVALYLLRKIGQRARMLVLLVLLGNLAACGVFLYAGKLGGEIRHTEVHVKQSNLPTVETISE
ncbi:DUF2231 domain-containing protein [Adhaeribacter soli]|uniref:DUF2231 domain-containing protein n=1 Tax=Adhaeribacter soli TaxID=2607655 RepID=A0A5N1IJP0_9BACT|nr:DUF2231 domain-containing protein [Adhaeribacter soli]KAA9325962.1 hypothetical protein F0P94_16185 [Adhaeribacter soli]